ncbi:MAG: hypothetical protein HZC28_20585 [Spirochaetes bacterium]|nr:hypothetical protein [Spirochaetota bacterium]
MDELKVKLIEKYIEYKKTHNKSPSSREFYKYANISDRTLSKLFGSNAYGKLVIECGDDPNIFSTEKVTKESILEQWGNILKTENKNPSQADWLFYKCTPSIGNMKKNHGIKWTDLPKLFYDYAKNKSEWDDVIKLITLTEADDKTSLILIDESENDSYKNYLPLIIHDLENLSVNETKSLEFEKKVNVVFQLLGFDVDEMGQGTGRNPDGIAKNRQNHYAIIIDSKSRKEKYSIGTEDRKFIEYIKKYLPILKKEGYEFCYFLVVSSNFSNITSTAINNIFKETNVKTSFLSAKDLLKILSNKIQHPNKNDLSKFKELLFQGGVIDSELVEKYLE